MVTNVWSHQHLWHLLALVTIVSQPCRSTKPWSCKLAQQELRKVQRESKLTLFLLNSVIKLRYRLESMWKGMHLQSLMTNWCQLLQLMEKLRIQHRRMVIIRKVETSIQKVVNSVRHLISNLLMMTMKMAWKLVPTRKRSNSTLIELENANCAVKLALINE